MIRRLNCPICEKELPVQVDGESSVFPFCSKRCKLADLNRWLNGEYVVSEQLDPDRMVEELLQQEFPSEFEESSDS